MDQPGHAARPSRHSRVAPAGEPSGSDPGAVVRVVLVP